MRGGRLRNRIAIQSTTTTQDTSSFEPVESWGTTSTVWGSVVPLSGRELEHAAQIAADVTHEIRVRGGTSITNDMRLVYDSRNFHVLSVMDKNELGAETVIMAKEIV